MRVLFIGEDENYLRPFLSEIAKDFVVDVAYSSDEGEYLAEINCYDSIVIDAPSTPGMLPCLCDRTRGYQEQSSIILLSKDCNSEAVVGALRSGVDICLPKPVSSSVLRQALTTLVQKRASALKDVIKVGGLSLNLTMREISVEGVTIILRKKEYDILEYLLVNNKKVVSKWEILEHVWEDSSYVLSNCVEVHIKHIRNKIETPFGKVFIKTVRGFGYRIG